MGELLKRRAADLHDAISLALRDLDVLVQRVRDARSRTASETEDQLVAFGGGALVQGYYTRLERIFERVARDLNSSPLEGPDWHRRLLRSMTLDRPGVRPPLLEPKLVDDLDELLRFRHLFRNLYVLDLDFARIGVLFDAVIAIHPKISTALQEFAEFLTQLVATSSGKR